jgi:hypothetical protein
VVDAAAAVGDRDLADAKRPPVEGLDELDLLELDQRPEQAVHIVRRELLAVGVEEADELAVEHAERAPHRVALAEHRADLAISSDSRWTVAPASAASRAVSSSESPSITTTSSIRSRSRSATSVATIAPTVAAQLRAGRQTDTRWRRARSSSTP